MTFKDDPLAQGIYNYHFNRKDIPVKIYSENFDPDEVFPSYFFRELKEMPELEQKALDLCKGKVLDVGACAGCHTIPLIENGLEVTALEKSPLSCDVLKDRGVEKVIQQDLFLFSGQQFDTILLLMNGTGIAGTLSNLDVFFQKLKELLLPEGQILVDSSDLIYLFMDEDGSAMIDINAQTYYGELVYQSEFKKKKGDPFPWLYVGHELLKIKAEQNGFVVADLFEGEHYDYLARLILK